MSPAPVNLALDVTAVPDRPVGAGRYTIELARALAVRTDVALTCVARMGDGPRWAEVTGGRSGVAAAAPSARPLRLAWEQAVLPRLLAGRRVDLAHSPHYTMPERARLPKVVTVHDMTFFDHPDWHERAKVPVFRHAIRAAARHADAVVCVSRATADRFVERCRPQATVHVVEHGVDHARFSPQPAEDDVAALAAVGLRPPYVAFVGTLEPRKDVPSLVQAFARIAPHHPDLTLAVVGGRGWGLAAIDAAVAASPVSARIVRPGYVPGPTVAAVLRHAAAVAYPSLDEGFGLPALEAMACGAPLVTTSGTAMGEVASDAAVLVPPGDSRALAGALESVLAGGGEVEARRRRGLHTAARYTWEACAAGHVEVYRSVTGVTG